MEGTYTIEIHRRVYDNDNGQHLTVRPSADFPGNVMLFADKEEEEWFGPLRVDLPADFMHQLGKALIDAANEAKAA